MDGRVGEWECGLSMVLPESAGEMKAGKQPAWVSASREALRVLECRGAVLGLEGCWVWGQGP